MLDKKTEDKKDKAVEYWNLFNIKEDKSKWLMLTSILYMIISIASLGISLVFPFIRFKSSIRIGMIIMWCLSIALFWFNAVRMDIITRKYNEKKQKEYEQDKFVYIWSIITSILTVTGTLLCSFFNRSFGTRFNLLTIPIAISILMIALVIIIIAIANDKKKFFIDLGKSLLFIISILMVASGFYQIESPSEISQTTRIARMILITGGSSILLVMSIQSISKLISMNDRNNKKMNSLIAILLFVFGILLLTIIILNLPYNENIIGNIVTIFAGVLGGALTLIGVLMEIKHQEKVRKEEKLEKDNEKKMEFKPFFTAFAVSGLQEKRDDIRYYDVSDVASGHIIAKKEDVFDILGDNKVCHLYGLTFQNSDQSNFVIEKISIDGVESFNRDCLVRKNDEFYICESFILTKDELIPDVKIYTRDILNNRYVYKIEFKIRKTECEFDNGKFGSARKKKVVEVVDMFIKTIIELNND